MKPSPFTICYILLIVTFISCQKRETAKAALAETALIGTWELRTNQAGMLPAQELTPGNGTILQFSATQYTKYINHTPVQTGTYSVIEDHTASATVGLALPAEKFRHRIVLQNDENKRPVFFDVEGNRLSLVSGYFPLDYGLLQHYEKTATLK